MRVSAPGPWVRTPGWSGRSPGWLWVGGVAPAAWAPREAGSSGADGRGGDLENAAPRGPVGKLRPAEEGEGAGLPDATETPAPGSFFDLGGPSLAARGLLPAVTPTMPGALQPFPHAVLRADAYCLHSPPPRPCAFNPGRSLRLFSWRESVLPSIMETVRVGARSRGQPRAPRPRLPEECAAATPPPIPPPPESRRVPAVQILGSSPSVLTVLHGNQAQPGRPALALLAQSGGPRRTSATAGGGAGGGCWRGQGDLTAEGRVLRGLSDGPAPPPRHSCRLRLSTE